MTRVASSGSTKPNSVTRRDGRLADGGLADGGLANRRLADRCRLVDGLPLRQIGNVSVSEVNSVVSWLGQLTAEYNLPQKLMVLHEFKYGEISDLQGLDTYNDDLAIVLMDHYLRHRAQNLDVKSPTPII